MLVDYETVEDLLKRSDALVERLDASINALSTAPANEALLGSLSRDLHTLKGAAGFLDAGGMRQLCHLGEALTVSAEQRHIRLCGDDIDLLHDLVNAIDMEIERCSLACANFAKAENLIEKLQARCPPHTYRDALAGHRSFKNKPDCGFESHGSAASGPSQHLYDRLSQAGNELAQDLGKQVRFVFDDACDDLNSSACAVLGNILGQVVNNAIDHGIELPAERRRVGKSACGQLAIALAVDGATLRCSVKDDGQGIDYAALARSADKRSFRATEKAHQSTPIDLLCANGVTTQNELSLISGRGLGMGAVKAQLEELGGELQAVTTPGIGTEITFWIPTKSFNGTVSRSAAASRAGF